MENKQKQFVIYPHSGNEQIQPDLDPKDKLIYLAIRRYMNRQTKEAFPSYAKITEDTGAAAKTIKKCVDNLIKEGYLETRKEGRKIIYIFNNKKQFEPFSYDFLDKKDLTFTEKSYIVATQQYMFKDGPDEEGKINYTNAELSSLIKMPISTISKCNRSLEAKGYLEGSSELIKRFQLRELDQVFIWALKAHEEQIQQNTEDIAMLKKRIEKLEAENIELKKEKAKKENKPITVQL